jgi:hypothetical protein
MFGLGCFMKPLKVIGGLPCQVLKIVLGGGNELVVRVTCVLVVISLVIAGGDHDSLGSPF